MNAFSRLAAAEREFFTSEFLAPVLPNQSVRVRIGGVILEMMPVWPVRRKREERCGWGVFTPASVRFARFVRVPSQVERQNYLDLFPMVRLIVCRRAGDQWLGVPASHSDKRFNIPGLAMIALAEEIQLFDTVAVRFDGHTLWYDASDEQSDLRLAVYLRDELRHLTEPAKIDFPGITPELRDAYIMAFAAAYSADLESKRDKVEERLKAVLERAGASYQSYIERADVLTVEFRVGGSTFKSTVKKDDLSVVSAGICLSGRDAELDLASLVPTIAEGQRRGAIVTVGNGGRMTEEGYQRMYGNGEQQEEYNDDE